MHGKSHDTVSFVNEITHVIAGQYRVHARDPDLGVVGVVPAPAAGTGIGTGAGQGPAAGAGQEEGRDQRAARGQGHEAALGLVLHHVLAAGT